MRTDAELLQPQFQDVPTQAHAARLGMWLFLASETLLFGALFGLYIGYRLLYRGDFAEAMGHTEAVLGTLNTAVLITSSFTAAAAIDALRSDKPRRVIPLLGVTMALALAFLVIKGTEYGHHFAHGIFPGSHFSDPALSAPGVKLFFTLYYLMTGLHALHVLGGMGALGTVAWFHHRRPYTAQHHVPVDLCVLYWHLVDVVWIFLWPTFYLLK
jgi:cytochrome c oxidase subunit 3